MNDFRYFPFLGVRKFNKEYKELFGIPDDMECTALTFEWGTLVFVVFGKMYPSKKKDDNGN